MNELTMLSGCSGIGGLDLGFSRAGFRTVCYIEYNQYCQQVILERMSQGRLDTAPIFTDFKRFDGRPWRGTVDCFVAGIPCQPHSIAGSRRGAEDDRNLWPDMRRIIREMGPGIVVVENVAGLFVGKRAYGLTIMGELKRLGYCVAGITLSAREVGAWHKRNRRFIIGMADTKCSRHLYGESEKLSAETGKHAQCNACTEGDDVPDTTSTGLERFQHKKRQTTRQSYWQTEPNVGRVVDGVSGGMDGHFWKEQIKALGNAVVPQVAEEIGKVILELVGHPKPISKRTVQRVIEESKEDE